MLSEENVNHKVILKQILLPKHIPGINFSKYFY